MQSARRPRRIPFSPAAPATFLASLLASLLALAALFALCARADAAYIMDLPSTLTQPDGSKISCFLTGDEYYNWAHDARGYVIIQHPQTGYWVYAAKVNGQVVATDNVVGSVDPAAVGLTPNVKPDPSILEARRSARVRRMYSSDGPQPTPRLGSFTNLVVFIRFQDDAEYTTARSTYETLFNGTGNSLRFYYLSASYGELTINSSMYPTTTTTNVISYQDIYPRRYYQPYNATTNPDGYTDQGAREQSLLARAVQAVSSQIPSDLNVDVDNDGVVDNIVFIVKGAAGAWSSLLWPHAWALYTQTVNINGKRIWGYNLQLEDFTLQQGCSVLAHEMGHSLGMPDLYRYNTAGTPVGPWDLMANNTSPPQHMSTFMKQRYLGWISAIPEITQTGTYTLNPIVNSTNNCYKIKSPNTDAEYFVVEYRRKAGTFDGALPGSGLIVYRINTKAGGNASGPPDEVYVYRPGGTTTSDGNINAAPFTASYGRTAITDTTSPAAFLSDGSPSGLNISAVGLAGATISFTVTIAPPAPSRLMFQPYYGDARLDTPFEQKVSIINVKGRLATDSTLPVTLSLKAGTGTEGAVLSGPTTVNAVGGVATFSGLKIDKPGIGYVLVASSDGLTGAESAPLNVTDGPIATRLTFQSPIPDTRAEEFMPQQPVVAVLDQHDNVMPDLSVPVSIVIKDNTGTSGAVLRGTTTVMTTNGVTGFNNLSIDKPGTGYVLVASSGTLQGAESTPFAVTPFIYSLADVATAARWASGLSDVPLMPMDIFGRFDAEQNGDSYGQVDMLDAVRIARKVAGLEPNP